MAETHEATPPKADVQNLSEFLDRLGEVLDPETMAKATAALRPAVEEAPLSPPPEALPKTDVPAAKPASEAQMAAGNPSEASGSMMRLLELGVTGLISVVLALALFTVFSKPTKPAISFAMLDANIAVAKYLETPGVSDLDEQAFGAAVTEFHKALQAEMKQFSAETGRVLLAGSVVFAGDVPDVTEKLTAAAMAKVGKK